MTSDRPQVSVLMSVRNGGAYLTEALASAVSQTDVSSEVVVMDIASDDETPAILEDYREQVQSFRTAGRLSKGRARTFLLNQARGEYVTFLDHDDLLLPASLRTRVGVMNAHPRLSWVCSDVEDIDAYGRRIALSPLRGFPSPELLDHLDPHSTDALRWRMLARFLTGNRIQLPSVLLRREFVATVGGFHPELTYCEDYEYWLRCLLRAPLAYVPIPTAQYRWHTAQSTARSVEDTVRTNQARVISLESALAEANRMDLAIPRAVRLLWSVMRVVREVESHFELGGIMALGREARRRRESGARSAPVRTGDLFGPP